MKTRKVVDERTTEAEYGKRMDMAGRRLLYHFIFHSSSNIITSPSSIRLWVIKTDEDGCIEVSDHECASR